MPIRLPLKDPLQGHPRYRKIRDINTGAFGFVVLAEDKLTNEVVATKLIQRGPSINVNVEREVCNHKDLMHQHVIQFKDVFLTEQHLGIVMDYAPGGDLLDYLHKTGVIPEDLARWVFQQLIVGLDYCHKMGVVNRDIKLENVLLDNKKWPVAKICDFGYSQHVVKDSVLKARVGTRPYVAPEMIFRNYGDEPRDGKKADIWSCGVLLYVMMVGYYPFERPEEDPNKDAAVILKRLRDLNYEIPENCMSLECEDLIRKILVEPSVRLSIAEIQDHPWYQTNLPVGTMEANKKIKKNVNAPSDDEILALCNKARIPL